MSGPWDAPDDQNHSELDALDRFYQWLQARPDLLSGPLYVTGYSLGGHLAQLFTEMHPEAVAGTVLFNAPGRGSAGDTCPAR